MPRSVLLVGLDDASFSEFTPAVCPRLTAFRATAFDLTNLWSHPVCSQSRGGLLFGSYGKAIGTIRDLQASVGVPPASYPTLPALLAGSKFQTCLVGKWHCGQSPGGLGIEMAPIERGYHEFRAGTVHNLGVYTNWTRLDATAAGGSVSTEPGYATQVQLNEAIDWWQTRSGKRFMHVAFNAPHSPYHVPPASLLAGWPQPGSGASNRTKFLAMLRTADTAFGTLLDAVGAQSSVWVYSDNGTSGRAVAASVDPLKAKETTFRAGTQVLGLARWGGVPTGPDNRLQHLIDFPVGILTVAGVPLPPEWDGQNAKRPSILSEREELDGSSERACRSNTYLLRQFEDVAGVLTEELYDIVNDPGETAPVDLALPIHAAALAYLRAQLLAAAL